MPADEPICYCGHMQDEHLDTGECDIEECPCLGFEVDPDGDLDAVEEAYGY